MAIVPDRYYHRSQITEFAQVIREYNQTHEEGIGAAQFRDKYGMGRKLAVQILEFLTGPVLPAAEGQTYFAG